MSLETPGRPLDNASTSSSSWGRSSVTSQLRPNDLGTMVVELEWGCFTLHSELLQGTTGGWGGDQMTVCWP